MSEQRRHEAQSKFEKLAQSLLDGERIPADNWTTSLQDVPALTHAVVEQEECANSNVCILQSFVPESKKSKYFLIRKTKSVVQFLTTSPEQIFTMTTIMANLRCWKDKSQNLRTC